MTTPEADERRRRQPALFAAAECACGYRLTDGFCTPRNKAACKCWDNAEAVIAATGLSAQAVAWIFRNGQQIERDAMPIDGPTMCTHPQSYVVGEGYDTSRRCRLCHEVMSP